MTELVKTNGTELATITPAQEEVAPDSVTVMPKGERVVVKRTNGALEYNWHVVGVDTRIDRETGASVEYRIVQKTENDKVLTKALKLTELLAIKEKLDDKFKRDMGEPAIVGAAADGAIDYGYLEAVRIHEGPAIEEVEVASVEAAEPDPFDALSPDAQREILELRTAKANKALSEANRNYSQAARDKDTIIRLEQNLSQEAVEYRKKLYQLYQLKKT